MDRQFDLYLGIDWTGAQPARSVAMAACDAAGLVRPIQPQGRFWERLEVAQWIADQAAGGKRILAGFDFAFAMPWVPGQGYLDGRVPDVADMLALWDLVEEASAGGADAFAGAAVLDPRLFPSFWINGPTPSHWGDGSTKRRRVEMVAADTGAGTPVSVFKLAAAAKQVGKASLAGMRTLRHLHGLMGDGLCVWPLEIPGPGQSVVMEIYPTLFRKQALGGNRKVVERKILQPGLAFYGCHADASLPDRFDDHIGDAMISAAGLRHLARQLSAWAPAWMDADTARREGWIFGVGA
ncbi:MULTISPECIES: hypothetical protein [unclassified Azospirillum]|uniref:hypothetical protein n=1 Tax=unclassified Azospirillum TaxID=2630922 RepID=UPI000B6C1D0E|nr:MULTISPECIES: hypothetical protein [unclassified Azospirillum]SNS37093.1 hypothetical protein SAMN05880556_104132 [Azospirillum sp. RU38E]SNS55484.1 hypothetical protein SAMN05880591_104132 [Azospirillum sp. RU37A]